MVCINKEAVKSYLKKSPVYIHVLFLSSTRTWTYKVDNCVRNNNILCDINVILMEIQVLKCCCEIPNYLGWLMLYYYLKRSGILTWNCDVSTWNNYIYTCILLYVVIFKLRSLRNLLKTISFLLGRNIVSNKDTQISTLFD